MRKLFIFLFCTILACTTFEYWLPRPAAADYGKVLREQMNGDVFQSFEDCDCGFTVHYPSFFQLEPRTSDTDFGHNRFAYHDEVIDSVLETTVIPNRRRLSPRELMAEVAREKQPSYAALHRDSFIIAGTVRENEGIIDGYRYREKYVLRNNAWYVLTLYYPKTYEHAFERLITAVDAWKG